MTEMGEIDHTNPYTDEPFVRTYRRGQIVAADGGERDAAPGSERDVAPDGDHDAEDDEDETMEDVPHTSPNEGTNRTFERGREGRDDSV